MLKIADKRQILSLKRHIIKMPIYFVYNEPILVDMHIGLHKFYQSEPLL